MTAQKTAIATLCALSLMPLTGCKESAYPAQLKTFSSAIGTAATSVGAIYSSLNDDEQTLYFESLLIDPNRRLGTRDFCQTTTSDGKRTIRGADTLLATPRFPPKEIALRTGILQALQHYADALSKLAGNSAPDDVKKSLADLATSYKKVAPLLGGSKLAGQAGPLASIFGDGASIYLQRRRTAELSRIIVSGKATVDGLIDALSADAVGAQAIELSVLDQEVSGWQLVYERVRYATLNGRKAYTYSSDLPYCPNGSVGPAIVLPTPIPMSTPAFTQSVALNAQRDAALFAMRQSTLQNAAASEKALQSLRATDVAGTLAALKKTYDRLADFAAKPDNQLTLDNLQSAMSEFGSDAEDMYTNLQTLSSPPKKGT